MPNTVQRKTRRGIHRKSPIRHDFGHRPDLLLLAIVIGLVIFGLLMIYNVSAYEGFNEFGNKFHFVKQQLIWITIGSSTGLVAYLFPYEKLVRLAPVLLFAVIFFLILVLIPGVSDAVLGARRWIDLSRLIPFLPGFTIQPAEFVKPTIVLYLAAWFASKNSSFALSRLASLGFIILLILGLVMLEPDLGTTIVIVSIMSALYFIAGAPLKQLLLLIPAGLLGIAGLIIAEPYRMQRLLTFLNPESDPQGSSYHISQILVTLGSGGMFGVGLGNSGQKYGYLPEASTDSIFAVIAGELGFIGAIILLLVYVFLVQRAFQIARNSPDRVTGFIAMGITVWFAIQVIVNIGSMVALFPLTGIPLPFISYGGSSLVSVLFGTGLLLNISRYTRQVTRS